MSQDESERPRVYNRITTLRRETGISREDLAGAVGINVSTLSVIERGEREPKVTLAWRIADYFGLPAKAVFAEAPLTPLDEILRQQYPCSASSPSRDSRTDHQYNEEGE